MKKLLIILIMLNTVLVVKYWSDSTSIHCEPCPPDVVCPPCQTTFMENIWWFVLGINAIFIFVLISVLLKRK